MMCQSLHEVPENVYAIEGHTPGSRKVCLQEETRSYMYDICIERRSGRKENAGSKLSSERIRSSSGYTSQADFMKRARS
jgi:hypothetical protein